tara:strand:+ start:304 stop:606 length:303 start_codon:yes stop_codon:yes gene_type:complete
MGALLQQAQMMQKKMQEVENKLKTIEVEGQVSEGLVKVTMNGKAEIKKIKIDPSLKEDIEVIEDLLMAAIAEAKKKADNLSESEMKSVTGGMPMPPGLKL